MSELRGHRDRRNGLDLCLLSSVWRVIYRRKKGRFEKILGHLVQVPKVPMVFLGPSLLEHGYHSPYEYFDWHQASGGMRTFVHYFDRIASLPT